MHDSTLAEWGGVYDKLAEINQRTNGKCCVGCPFKATNAKYLVKSAQDMNKGKDAEEIVMIVQATQLRQAAEWGM